MNPGKMNTQRQKRWQDKQLKKGRCRICGKKRAKGSKNFCPTHLEADRIRSRRYQAEKAKGKKC